MMTRILRTLLALVLAAALPASAQQPYLTRTAILASAFDLDGEAADADQVVTVIALTDSATFTVAANPDICRLVDITIVDADSSISAGVLTVVGTDCWDRPLTTAFTFAAGGSGVGALIVVPNPDGTLGRTSGPYYKTVTAVGTGVLTGEGGADTVTVGYTANSPNGWALYGQQTSTPSGARWVDVFGAFAVPVLVKNGAATTDITAVSAATTAPFQNVSAGDLLVFNVGGEVLWRKVTTRTDADNVIVNTAVTIPTAGVTFSYKKFYYSSDPFDGWIPVQGYASVYFLFDVDANTDTGGIVSSVQCVPNIDAYWWAFEVDTDTVATGATGTHATSIDLSLAGVYTHCRLGIKFGTGDDNDTGIEAINLSVGFVR